MRRWLSPPDPSTNLNTAMRLRHPGSGEWFLGSEEYSTWKSKLKASLWLNGKPGCGKSVLSSTIILDREKSSTSHEDDPILLYYFFDFNDKAKCSVDGLVRSLAFQAYCKIFDAQVILGSLFSSCQEGEAQPTFDALFQCLKKMLHRSKHVQILIDALDECADRGKHRIHGLLSCIRDFYDSTQNIQLLMTSRPEQDIRSFMTRWMGEQASLPLQGDRVDSDICHYIHARVREHDGLARWRDRPEIQDEVESALALKADGMFRWVVCQFDALEKCLDPRTLRQALGSLPSDLDETYARIVQSIPSQHWPHAKRILQLLTYSDHPLTLDGVVDALAVNPDETPRFSIEDRMPIPEEVTSYCSGLVSLTSGPMMHEGFSESDSQKRGEAIHQLRLAHFSVKEWLMSDRLDTKLAGDLNEMTARTSIAGVCLSYLIELEPYAGEIDLKRDQSAKREVPYNRPFGAYATAAWPVHARFVESEAHDIRNMALEFFSKRKAHRASYKFWRRYHPYPPDSGWEMTSSEVSSALLCASYEGLTLVAEKCLEDGADVNEAGHRSMNALHLASYAGHEATVDMLLRHGADMDIICPQPGPERSKALHFAAEEGHDRVVNVLIRHGANVDDTTSTHVPLQRALFDHSAATVRLLLENGAQVSTRVLAYALQHNSMEIVQMLLDAGADIDAPCGQEKDALTLVLVNRPLGGPRFSAASIPLLLNKGASTRDKGEGNALYLAAVNGNEQAVSLLLKHGVNTNEESGQYGTALQACSIKGHSNIALELLDNGADVNIKGGEYGNALYAAILGRPDPLDRRGIRISKEKFVLMLIERGADLHAPGKTHHSPLDAALSKGTPELVSIILENLRSSSLTRKFAVTEQMLLSAATNFSYGKPLMAILLDLCGSITLTSVPSTVDGTTEAKLLDRDGMLNLSQRNNADCVPITHATIEAASRNWRQGREMLALLFEKLEQDVAINEDILLAAVGGSSRTVPERKFSDAGDAHSVISFLLDKCDDHNQVTSAVIDAAFSRGFLREETLRALLRHCLKNVPIDESLASALFRDKQRTGGIFKVLNNFMNTEEEGRISRQNMVLFAARLGRPYMSTDLLELCRLYLVSMTEDILTAVAEDETDGAEIMADIIKSRQRERVQISERVVMAAARNKQCGHGIVDVLLQLSQPSLSQSTMQDASAAASAAAAACGNWRTVELLRRHLPDDNINST